MLRWRRQGIGRSAAILFAREGAKVVVADLDEAKAQKVVDEIKAAGGEATAIGGDVTALDFPKRLVDATVQTYGQINHVVNNAGYTWDKMLHTMDVRSCLSAALGRPAHTQAAGQHL
jgi:3-oxoacyl-[acyl-carrier protein] reductase